MKPYNFIQSIDSFCSYNNPWTFKVEPQIDESHGSYPDKREMNLLIRNGIINVDKPPGPTSHEVAFWLKGMLSLDRVGHGGTLER
ncbi:tRNA pseudouridine synthase A [Sulfuracidifex tepidarius]|uniref:tRNA pseudouridine synthase B n=1 Tax=Sulfuracidifex tepidarius TaxID=1294262 RepID=A0A510DVY1_9CREN|nr:tRNA pseudouridine synthase A [Sulfuracidifex tepidarius]BBG24180.1 putative tRNA pseudouridine synthase B [Sulfuracidifex tepidarius]BBG26937.1 putative tRNA pseudouridine synthase B [Sulfuracidifex tepidarius]